MGKSTDDGTDPRNKKKRSGSDQSEVVARSEISGPAHSKSDYKDGRRFKASLSGHPYYTLLKELTAVEYSRDESWFQFEINDLVQILIKMKSILSKEPPLVRTSAPVVIVGDIHGQFNDLNRVMDHFGEKDRPGWLTRKFIFLGDYVDRGKQSLEVIVFVFLMKISFPDHTILLRGNHECKPINRVYGFMQEMMERFGKEQGTNLFHMFNEAFTHLPLACLVGGAILCMHGGISPRLTSLDEIMKIPKPLVDPNTNELACDLMWADPMINLKGFKPNAIRGVSVHFGEDVLHTTMAQLGVKLIVRGHQMMMNGYNFFGNKKLATVFTAASYYPDKPNHGAVMQVDAKGVVSFHVIAPRSGEGANLFPREHEDANKFDVGYIISVADEKKMLGGGPRM